jgi:ParB family chromosome partitioning protein
MNTNTAIEYRNLPLAVLTESATNPRRTFEDPALKELADFVSGHKIGFLFRRPFCGRTSRMALSSERSAFRATHNGSAERKRNRDIRVRESEESCHGQVERLSSIIHAEGVREYCSTDN